MLKMRLSFKSTCTCTAEPLVIQLQPPLDSKNREITPWNSMEIAPWSCCMEFNGKFSMEFRRQKFHGTQLHS